MKPTSKSLAILGTAMALADLNQKLRQEPTEPLDPDAGLKEAAKRIQKEQKEKIFLVNAYRFGNKRVREAAGRVLYPEKHIAPKCKECENLCPPGKVCCSADCWKAYGERTRI
jgi:hypothetical protein